MIVLKVFNEKYGDDVTEEMIDEQFNNVAEQYGGSDSFESTLTASGYTVKSYRAELKEQLALREGLKANMDITDEEMKTAWDSFHPEVEAQIIKVASEDDAKDVLEEAKKMMLTLAKSLKKINGCSNKRRWRNDQIRFYVNCCAKRSENSRF